MKTERLIIDQIKETDKADYFINISHDKKVLETFICRYADTMEEFDFSSYPGRQDLFAIRLKETGRLIGIILYFDEKEDSCEIGYGIGSGFWNQGFATEAVGRFLEYLFRKKGMRTVYASFFTGNDASRRVMEKCGMTYDHFSEKELTYLGVERDLTYYVISKIMWDNQTLITFWNKALSLSEADRAELRNVDPERWKDLAPSKKLFEAACSLGKRKKVLDYGCGNAWAAIIAAKGGCPDVTAVDAAPAAVQAASLYSVRYGTACRIRLECVGTDWLQSVPSEMYDGIFCSNILDVIPPQTAEEIIRETARIIKRDGSMIVGLNYYLSPDAAAERDMKLIDGSQLYIDGILRLVSRTDEEWTELFSPWYVVDRLEHFAWPREKVETRRLYYLKKREAANE